LERKQSSSELLICRKESGFESISQSNMALELSA
jgi:hypothetical protein